jgi:hypothetical protein
MDVAIKPDAPEGSKPVQTIALYSNLGQGEPRAWRGSSAAPCVWKLL